MIDKKLLGLFKRPTTKQMERQYPMSLTPVKPVVTLLDSERGYITRYFARPTNDTSLIVEIDGTQYHKLSTNPRFVCVELEWKIVGKKKTVTTYYGAVMYGVEDINHQRVIEADLTFGGLLNYISDFTEFWVSED